MERVLRDSEICRGRGYLFELSLRPEFKGAPVTVIVRDGADYGAPILCEVAPDVNLGMGRIDFNPPIAFQRGLFVSGIGLENRMKFSADITAAGWAEDGDGSIDDATHFTFVSQHDTIRQADVVTIAGSLHTLFVYARVITGNTNIAMLCSGGDGVDAVTQTFGLTLAWYANTWSTPNAAHRFGLKDTNAAGQGQMEIISWGVILGEFTAAEIAAKELYRKTLATARTGAEKVTLRYMLERGSRV